MKAFKLIAGLVVATTAIVAISSASASAHGSENHTNTKPTKCDVKGTALGHWGETFKVNDNGTITSTFEVIGKDCTTPVTLAVWDAPSANGQPILEQELFSYVTETFGPGTHTLTSTLPDNCYFQADLLKSDNPKAPDGTAHYAYQNGEILKVHPLRDFKYGGERKCEEDPETPEQPKGGQGGQTKSTQTTKSLPVTGPASVIGAFAGVSASGTIAHAVISRRKRQ